MPSIRDIEGALEKLRSEKVAVLQHRCVMVRNRHVSCLACAHACPTDCISLDGERLSIAPERCIGCGTCASVCPTCALIAQNPTDAELFKRCVEAMRICDGTVVFACSAMVDMAAQALKKAAVVEVRCLGRIEESLLVLLAGIGAKRIVFVASSCEACDLARGRQAAACAFESATAVFDAWGVKTALECKDRFPSCVRAEKEQGYDASKRRLFSKTGQSAAVLAHGATGFALDKTLGDAAVAYDVQQLHVTQNKTLTRFLPARRARLLEALRAFGQPDDVLIDCRLWAHAIIDAHACASCGMCATFCPTGAIEPEDASRGPRPEALIYRPDRCVKCRTCVQVCRSGALSLSEEVFARDIAEGAFERIELPRATQEAGNLRAMHVRMKDLIGIEEVYDH